MIAVLMKCISGYILLLGLFGAVSCATQYETLLQGTDAEAKYQAAFRYYADRKYTKSAELFESVQIMYDGTVRADTVAFYVGMSNFKYGDMLTAGSNFTNFVSAYPASPFAESAAFLKVVCLYEMSLRYELEQSSTNEALMAINDFRYRYPDSEFSDECDTIESILQERLDRKSYESAKLYYTTEDYKAAVYALRNVLKENASNMFREEIKYYTAAAAYRYAYNSVRKKQADRYMDFIDVYFDFVGEFPESSYRKPLDIMFLRARRVLNRNFVVPEEYSDINLDGKAAESMLKDSEKFQKSVKPGQKARKYDTKALRRSIGENVDKADKNKS